MLQEGQRVRVPSPNGEEEIEATYLGPGDPDDAVEVPLEGGSRKADVGWVRYEEGDREGTTHRYPYSQIKPVD